MSVNIHLLRGGRKLDKIEEAPKEAHWQVQFMSTVSEHNPYGDRPGERESWQRTVATIYIYTDKSKWEEDILKLYDEDHNRTDFVAVAVGSPVRPQTTITLDYGPPAAPSRLEVLRDS